MSGYLITTIIVSEKEAGVQVDSIPLYYDDDHLSEAGAGMLVNEIMKALNPKAP